MKNIFLCFLFTVGFGVLRASATPDEIMEWGVFPKYTEVFQDYNLLNGKLKMEIFEVRELSNEVGPHVPVVLARFEDTLFSKGWGILDLETKSIYHDGVQAYSAGFAEGYATAQHIYNTSVNVASVFFKKFQKYQSDDNNKLVEMPEILKRFFLDQEEWTMKLVQENIRDENSKDFDFYFHVGLVMEQFDGLVAGYEYKRQEILNKKKEPELPKLERWAFQMLNAAGDLNDLVPALLKSVRNEYDYLMMDPEVAEFTVGLRSSCSAIVKVLDGNEDLLVGHSTWFSYSWTNRIFKHYTFNFNNQATASKSISFSSYPGFLESLDDFYMLGSGLTWTQTSNSILNISVYDGNIKSSSLLAWQRVRVASAMSAKGSDFLKYMRKHFSGTYANQYIVVDYNLFTPGQDLLPNTLWVVEEMPGLIVGADKTEILTYGYWPSYNVPAFEEIYNKSGYPEVNAKFKGGKTSFSHSLAPRAEIFRRDHHKVNSIEGLKKILRFNNFEHDQYSHGNPSLSLCSRYDLVPQKVKEIGPRSYGCYDTKVTGFTYGAKLRKASIISGPTSKNSLGESYIDPFSWEKFDKDPHRGLPTVYDFPFIDTQPFYTENEQEIKQPTRFRTIST